MCKKGVLTFEWSNLPVSLLRAFLVLVPDEDGWDVGAESAMKWSDEECVSAVEKYDRAVDLSLGSGFFWPTELREALELEANVEVFNVSDGDLAVLASVEAELMKKKRDDARKKVAAMSPGSKARAMVRPPSRTDARRKGEQPGSEKASDEVGNKRRRSASGEDARPQLPPDLVDATDELVNMTKGDMQKVIDEAVKHALAAAGSTRGAAHVAEETAAEKAIRTLWPANSELASAKGQASDTDGGGGRLVGGFGGWREGGGLPNSSKVCREDD